MRKALVALVLLAVAPPSAALAQDTHFKIFGAAAYVAPLNEEDVDFGSVQDSVEASDELGWAFGFEWRWGKLLGLEVDYVNSTQDIELGGEAIAEVDFQPVSASLNIHLIHTTFIDLYVAPTASYIDWGDVEVTGSAGNLNVSNDIETDAELAWGAQIGLDIGLGETFVLTGGVRWLSADLSPDDDDVDELGIDPLISRVGVGLRF
jgi:hypothetical protein